MRIQSAIALAATLVVALSACGSDSGDSTNAPIRPPRKVAALGPFVGECGHVTDDEVRATAGVPQISQVRRNSVGCNWQSAGLGSPSVTFASYRGSPIARERAWVTTQGRSPETIEVAGRQGFQALEPTGTVCDLAVQLDDDFFEWSMQTGRTTGRVSPCDLMRKLAELTVQRLK
ncbi:DUF3558 domain-containing protein [Nocardia panacis]|uniref:DUF3558 domain-containing protein n=1 Tax=Nocardia panacis TaxID=2340916 RepID=A0A3A4K9L8_9NOCA|nr:DUF3558 domain-containing protein [Nocardia panacis]RJO76480.1 DUF3558 domain-containing protein [Nocardia panacis]